MEYKTWIKKHLEEYFSATKNDAKLRSLIDEKIKIFGGKLYKYYSFEDAYSIKNIYDKTIHFSKPEKFNDPFDCALGFSLDKAVAAFLPNVIETRLDFADAQAKQLVKQLLSGERTETNDNKTVEIVKLLLTNPKFKIIIEKYRDGDFSSEEEFNNEVMQVFSDQEFFLNFLTLLQTTGQEGLLDNFKNIDLQSILQLLIDNPKEMKQLIPIDQLTSEIDKGVDIITALSSEGSIANKIVKLAELSGENTDELWRTFDNIKRTLTPLLEDTKKYVNNAFAISCFSESSDSILMWSHYANKHTGFCVEYDLSRCDSMTAKLLLFPVIYSEERATIPMSVVDFSVPDKPKSADASECIPDFIVALLTKSQIWEYEKEWRIIELQQNLIEGHLLWSDMVTKVYLGANASPENEQSLREAIGDNIPVEKYVIDKEKYRLILSE